MYLLQCGDGSIYTGYTNDLQKRLAAHQAGRGARYTRGRGPLQLLYWEEWPDQSAAMRREAALKKLPHTAKQALAASAAAAATKGNQPEREDHQEIGAKSAGTLYVCATPIGNLEDITLRALRILREADRVAAEDTRETRKLLTHYEIPAAGRLVSYHEHNQATRGPELIAELLQGRSIALVTDAGLPGISDPGQDLVRRARAAQVPVVVVPGANAALTALLAAGVDTSRFAFEGFLPRTGKARRQRLSAIAADPRSIVLYESPHRLVATLDDLAGVIGARPVSVARELTKRFEETRTGSAAELAEHYRTAGVKGEISLVIEALEAPPEGTLDGAAPVEGAAAVPGDLAQAVMRLTENGISQKEAMRSVAQKYNVGRRAVYEAVLAAKGAKAKK